MRTFYFFLIFLSVVTTFVAPVDARASEKVLRLLVWEGYAPEEYRERFHEMMRKKYGRTVDLQVTYVQGSDEFYPPIRQGEVDVVTLTHHHFNDERFNYISNGLLLPLSTKNIPRFKNIIPSVRDAGYLRKNGEVFGAPVCQGLYALVFNNDKVTPEPSSWSVLWAPEHKGAYTLGANEFLYNICTTALAMGYPKDKINSFDYLNNAEFREKLRSLVKNAGGFWIGQDKAKYLRGKSLSAGWGDGVTDLRESGEDWRFADPKEGAVSWLDSYAMTHALAGKPFLQKAAQEWINFLLSPDFQINYIVRVISQHPTITSIEDLLTEEEKQRLHVGGDTSARDRNIPLPAYSQRDRNGLKLLWEDAMKGVKINPGGEQ